MPNTFPDEEIVVCRVSAWVDPLLDDGGTGSKGDRVKMQSMQATDPTDEEVTVGTTDDESTFVELLVKPGARPHVIDLRSEPLPNEEYRATFRLAMETVES